MLNCKSSRRILGLKVSLSSNRYYIYIYNIYLFIYCYLFIYFSFCLASFTDDCTHGNISLLTNTDGYLALYPKTSAARPAARPTCPWVLSVDAGRRFNVTWRLPASTGAHDAFESHHQVHGGGTSTSLGTASDLQGAGGVGPSAGGGGGGSGGGGPPSGGVSAAAAAVALCAASWRFVDGGEETRYAACLSNFIKPQERTFTSRGSRLEIHFTGLISSTGGGGGGGGVGGQIAAPAMRNDRLPVLHYTGG